MSGYCGLTVIWAQIVLILLTCLITGVCSARVIFCLLQEVPYHWSTNKPHPLVQMDVNTKSDHSVIIIIMILIISCRTTCRLMIIVRKIKIKSLFTSIIPDWGFAACVFLRDLTLNVFGLRVYKKQTILFAMDGSFSTNFWHLIDLITRIQTNQ